MSSPTRLVVGIGASAGGLEAFRAFLSRMPPDTGMVFVLVQHLDPHHDSALVAIIAGYTAMQVQVAEQGVAIQPNHIYVIPPDAILTIVKGTLHLVRPAEVAARRVSVNTFLASLAEDQGENAVGIILSGFGSDGAAGMAAIKAQGGLTLSQAEFDHHAKSGMPQSAAAGGFVDHVLAVEAMPAALRHYQDHRTIFDADRGPDGIRNDLPVHLEAICAVLHARLGRDFSQYKKGTLMRRIQRRMHVLQITEPLAYIAALRGQPHEAELLFREFLIGVTRFFRDGDAFAALEEKVIPAMLASGRRADPIRVWVAGCATGEEAYSFAILLKEGVAGSGVQRRIQIFATDIDDRAIEFARAGLYPDDLTSELSAERLERNFVKEGDGWRVAKDIREMCLFSVHDLVRDPPFSRLSLVSCRNLLIYFEPALQATVITTFHYALQPGGALLLGPSESIGTQLGQFEPLDKRQRIYLRQNTAARLPMMPQVGAMVDDSYVRRSVPPSAARDVDQRAARIMARYAPAYVVVDRQADVLRFSGQMARYLEPSAGAASLNLFNLLHADLRNPVRAAIAAVATDGKRVLRHAALTRNSAPGGEAYDSVGLIVELLSDRLADPQGAVFIVAFQIIESAEQGAEDAPGSQDGAGDAAIGAGRQLLVTRERLRQVSDELETSRHELQSANEEYLSVNEELQSANEELETSKEELQSLNEELQTINAELQNRNESLIRSNSDLANLFDSTAIAILFLDRDLRIRRFTPRLLDIFKVREGDEGRPIGDIVTHLRRDGLADDVATVLRHLLPVEREVSTANGTSYLMQVRPYQDHNTRIDGAVVTFVDISERKLHERAQAQLAAIVASSQDGIISHDLSGTITSWNAGAEALFGYAAADAIGRPIAMLLEQPEQDDWPDLLERLRRGERIELADTVRLAKGGRPVEVAITVSPVLEPEAGIVGASVVARDIQERRAIERQAALLRGELDHRVKNILAVVSAVISQTVRSSTSLDSFAGEIKGRIQAVATAHDLLMRSDQSEVSLRGIVQTELAPYDHGQLHVTGRDVMLTARAGVAIAMAIHELSSNAAKYGALSTNTGSLTVAWTATGAAPDKILRLTWSESGGPAVRPPTRSGFGTTLIERSLTQQFGADVRRDFLPSGLECTMMIPLGAEFGRDAGQGGMSLFDADLVAR